MSYENSPLNNSMDKHTHSPDKKEKVFNKIIKEASQSKLKSDLDLKHEIFKFDNINSIAKKVEKKNSIKQKIIQNNLNNNGQIIYNSNISSNNFQKIKEETVIMNKQPLKISNKHDSPFDGFIHKPGIFNNENIYVNNDNKPLNNKNIKIENKEECIYKNKYKENFKNLNKDVKGKDDKKNNIEENTIKTVKINKRDFTEDDFIYQYNIKQKHEEKQLNNKNQEINKLFKLGKNTESQADDKYIFNTTKDNINFKACSDTSDVDKLISDLDEKDNKHNLFGKPFNNQTKGNINKLHYVSNKEYYENKINQNSNFDLAQIFGDCTK